MTDQTIPQPFTPYGHKARVDKDKFRVVCTECPWFWYLTDRTLEVLDALTPTLKDAARRHKNATRLR